MPFVDPDALGACDARTQGGSIVVTIGPTEDAAAPAECARATQSPLCESLFKESSRS
jgi:hypothetical protein